LAVALLEMMMNGLWTVEFGSTLGMFGSGAIVLEKGRVLGGDNGYFYVGTYKVVENVFHAEIDVTPFVVGIESVFNTLGRNLRIVLDGTLSDNGRNATARGKAVGIAETQFGVKLTKRV
jgi:hypothetical protein